MSLENSQCAACLHPEIFLLPPRTKPRVNKDKTAEDCCVYQHDVRDAAMLNKSIVLLHDDKTYMSMLT